MCEQALNVALGGAEQFPSDKGHFYENNVNLYLNFATGTTAIAVVTLGEVLSLMLTNKEKNVLNATLFRLQDLP